MDLKNKKRNYNKNITKEERKDNPWPKHEDCFISDVPATGEKEDN